MNLFDKLAEAENKFFASQFLSPVLRRQKVRVSIADTVMYFEIRPKNFSGWGIFKPIDFKTAKFVRNPNMTEKQEYLSLFPALRIILCRRNDVWSGIPAQHNDPRFVIRGLVSVELVEECQLFEIIIARFDGNICWFEGIDTSHSPKNAVYLRESLNNLLEPDKLELKGLTLEERDAYLMAYGPAIEADIESKKDKQEERIKMALHRAGATYQSYIERGNTFTVEYIVEGATHRSTVSKDNLEVQSAGICLSGGDRNFDLNSLVTVIKEGNRRNMIVRVNDGDSDYEDNDY